MYNSWPCQLHGFSFFCKDGQCHVCVDVLKKDIFGEGGVNSQILLKASFVFHSVKLRGIASRKKCKKKRREIKQEDGRVEEESKACPWASSFLQGEEVE